MDRQRQNPIQLVLIAGALAFLACTPSPRTAAVIRPTMRTSVAPGEAAMSYETAVPAGAAILDDEAHTIQQAIERAMSRSNMQLTGDPRLLRLSGWVAANLAPDGTLPSQAALDQVARHLGLVEPTPHVVVIASNSRDDVAARLGEDIGSLLAEHDYSDFGAAVIERDGMFVYVVALTFRFLELQPIPRSVPVGGSIVLAGRLTHGFAAPELAITRPDGQVVRGTPTTGSVFEFRVPAENAGVYRVEMLGQSALGITVVANFPVYVGEPANDSIELTAIEAPVNDPVEAAKRLLAMLNHERRALGVTEVVADPQLAQIAATHNDDMLAHGFVGHTSPTTGTAADRVAHAGIRTGLILENIGRGYSLSEVHAGLMESPGHRGNLLNPLATNVGIAVAIRDEDGHHVYLATQLFTRVTPKLSGHAAGELFDAINRGRQQHGRHQLQNEAQLSQIAERAARGCFSGAASGDAAVMDVVRDGLAKLPPRKAPVSALLSVASSLADLSGIAALLEPSVTSIGIGLAQGQGADTPPDSLCAVLLLAQ